jgi:hypothetical protein
MVRFYGGLR